MQKYTHIISLTSLMVITAVMLFAAHWYFSLVSMAAIFIPVTLLNIMQQPLGTTAFLLINAIFPFAVFALVVTGWECHTKKHYGKVFLYSVLPLILYTAILYGIDR